MSLLEKARQHVLGIVRDAILHTPEQRAMVIFDRQSGLSSLLADAYHLALPNAEMIDFDAHTPDDIRAKLSTLSPRDLVVLVQTSSFRLNEFRFRLELFERELAVIEHPHLGRMPEDQFEIYIDTLAYDKDYYRGVGARLKERLDRAKEVIVECGEDRLVYQSTFEEAKLNVGDYTGMKNIGGQFPIGEVFTEAADLFATNGWVKIFAFGDATFQVVTPEKPMRARIEKGVLVEVEDIPESFQKVLDQIKADEEVWVRELGLGMNRALSPTRRLTDIGSFERMCGIHLSLGQKHTIYAKPGMPKRTSKYHVDVMLLTTRVLVDGEVVFENGAYTV